MRRPGRVFQASVKLLLATPSIALKPITPLKSKKPPTITDVYKRQSKYRMVFEHLLQQLAIIIQNHWPKRTSE